MTEQSDENIPSGGSYSRWIFWGFLFAAGILFLVEHSAHVYEWFAAYGVVLLLLACPLMHLFMHRGGHGGHDGHGDDGRRPKP